MFHVLTAPGRLHRARTWFQRWSGLMPLFVAEFILWIGFGALLPVLPIYFSEHGVDIAMLGIVVAAWPAAKLVTEPVFGWLADRLPSRVPMMAIGLIVSAAAIGLSVVLTGPVPFFILRAIAGLGAAAYDPAARGVVTDATRPDKQGEAFGVYGSAQMGGLLLGPAFGGIGAAVFGGLGFTFAFSALALALAAIPIVLRVRDPKTVAADGSGVTPRDSGEAGEGRGFGAAPMSVANRLIAIAILINVAGWFSGGMYEVVWSLFLTDRGAGLDLVGLTFATFAVPVLFLSPIIGRLVDRRGPMPFMIGGVLMMSTMMALYPFIPDPAWAVPMIAIEGTGFALLGPATFAVIAAGSPIGRSSTAQGIAASFGTLATISASIIAGPLADVDLRYPFWVGAAFATVLVLVTLLVDGGRIGRRFASPSPAT
jgi:MFS family permease